MQKIRPKIPSHQEVQHAMRRHLPLVREPSLAYGRDVSKMSNYTLSLCTVYSSLSSQMDH